MRKTWGILLVSTLLLSGCSAPSGDTEPVRTSVEWSDYSATVKTTIDELETSKDCAGLQAQFENADANNDATMSRVGHNNADLMMYIDEALQNSSCY